VGLGPGRSRSLNSSIAENVDKEERGKYDVKHHDGGTLIFSLLITTRLRKTGLYIQGTAVTAQPEAAAFRQKIAESTLVSTARTRPWAAVT
jgi:hypothetical protein